MLMVFDVRQTTEPLHCLVGLSKDLIHTLHSAIDNNGCRKILSASAVGACMWDADDNQSRYMMLFDLRELSLLVPMTMKCYLGSELWFSYLFVPRVIYVSGRSC